MTSDDSDLRLAGPEAHSDCVTVLGRLLAADPAALVRLRARPDRDAVAFWAQPVGTLVRRDVAARWAGTDRTVPAAALAAAAADGLRVVLPPAADLAWRVSLPPDAGWTFVDEVPVDALHGLVTRAEELLRAAPTRSDLTEQTVLTVSSVHDEVALALRVVLALARTGFLPADGAARVACTSAWARIATPLGTAYQRRGASGLG